MNRTIKPRMWWDRKNTEAEQREQPRVRGWPGLVCSLGEVVDASPTGLRVICVGKAPARPGKLENLTLAVGADELAITARVVRIEPGGRRRYELGLEFIGLSAAQRGVLEAALHRGAPAVLPESDPYKTLGLERGASAEAVKRAYHRLALKYHPDASHTGETAREFQAIHEAYVALRKAQ